MPLNYANYANDWKARSRFVRHFRARNRCEWCHAPNGRRICKAAEGSAWWPAEYIDYLLDPEQVESMPLAWTWQQFGTYQPKRSRVVLTVAHLDHDRQNNAFHNLAALCQWCHLAYDKDLHRASLLKTLQERKAVASGQLDAFDQ